MIDFYQKSAFQKMKCEDYIVGNTSSLHDGENSFREELLVLCDGCSSSPNTHIGSMLMAENVKILETTHTKPFISRMNDSDWKSLAERANNVGKEILGINDDSTNIVDCTCMILKHHRNKIYLNICGDGVIIWKKKSNLLSIFVDVLEFSHNAPLYPSYFLRDDLMSIRRDKMNCVRIKTSYEFRMKDKVLETIMLGSETSSDSTLYREYNVNSLKFMAIASDGLLDFRGSSTPDIVEVIEAFTNFKGRGEFFKRKANHTVKKWAQEGIHPHDDFSMGVWVNEDLKEEEIN